METTRWEKTPMEAERDALVNNLEVEAGFLREMHMCMSACPDGGYAPQEDAPDMMGALLLDCTRRVLERGEWSNPMQKKVLALARTLRATLDLFDAHDAEADALLSIPRRE